jgi:hypothetical protein
MLPDPGGGASVNCFTYFCRFHGYHYNSRARLHPANRYARESNSGQKAGIAGLSQTVLGGACHPGLVFDFYH